MWAELMEVKFLEYGQVPKFERLDEMRELFQQLMTFEHEASPSV